MSLRHYAAACFAALTLFMSNSAMAADAQPVTDPVALSLRHDSRSLADKAPFGAVVAGTTVEFGLSAKPGVEAVTLVLETRRLEGNQDLIEYTEVARVPLKKVNGQRWRAHYAFKNVSVWGYWFEARIGGKTYVYQNNTDSVHWTKEKGSNGIGVVEDKPALATEIRRFRHTVHAADFKVPDWAQDAVYYYIFPSGFATATSATTPSRASIPTRIKRSSSTPTGWKSPTSPALATAPTRSTTTTSSAATWRASSRSSTTSPSSVPTRST
jgi:hypothetical protein